MLFNSARQRKAVMAKVGKRPETRNKMPEGWVRVMWSDASGKVFKDNMPESAVPKFRTSVAGVHGMVHKVIE